MSAQFSSVGVSGSFIPFDQKMRVTDVAKPSFMHSASANIVLAVRPVFQIGIMYSYMWYRRIDDEYSRFMDNTGALKYDIQINELEVPAFYVIYRTSPLTMKIGFSLGFMRFFSSDDFIILDKGTATDITIEGHVDSRQTRFLISPRYRLELAFTDVLSVCVDLVYRFHDIDLVSPQFLKMTVTSPSRYSVTRIKSAHSYDFSGLKLAIGISYGF